LLNSKIFKFNFSIAFLNELTLKVKEALYGPGEIIFTSGEADRRIFYINKGKVELFLEK
jgi:CRP-like cAMP-binding protein